MPENSTYKLSDWSEGVVLPVNKPQGWTSFDVVNKIRYMLRGATGLKRIKVGHAGTLDLLACGVLLVCTGKATKTIEELHQLNKEYLCTMRFGITTPSFDLETDIDARFDYSKLSAEQIENIFPEFTGEIEQLPPKYSALWVKGKRACYMARAGKSFELQPRKVFINSIKLEEYNAPDAKIRVSCQKGTYIRSLARDMGIKLQNGAIIVDLLRTKVGHYKLEDCFSIEDIEKILKT